MDACKDSTNIQDTDEYRRILMQTVYYSHNCSKDYCQHKGIHNPFFADVAFLHLELMTLQASDTQEAGHPEFFPGYIFHADNSVLLLYGKCGGGNFSFLR